MEVIVLIDLGVEVGVFVHQEKGPYVDLRFFLDMHVRFKMHVDMYFLVC
jgi:hypothetical protein